MVAQPLRPLRDGVPRVVVFDVKLALNQAEAAEALGMGVNTFKRQVRPFIRHVAYGRRMLFPVSELEAWLDKKARGL